MNRKKKVLLLTSRIPYPPIAGDKLKSYNLLRILSKHYSVYLVVITDEIFDSKIEKELAKYTIEYKLFLKPKYRCYLNTVKSLFNRLPLQVNYYCFKDVQKYINDISKNMDFSVCTLIRTSKYLENYKGKKYLDMVDSIALNYYRSKKKVESFFWKLIYTIEVKRLFNYEKKVVKEFDNTFYVNKFESVYWASFGRTTWIPNGVSENLLKYEKYNDNYKNCIVFFGKMDYQPNVDAVLWFVDNVLKKINKNITFLIVGTNPHKKISRLTKLFDNIKVTGFVSDPYEILKSSLLVVAPMQTGGGIQNKVLESMALGTINIVSSLAAKPIVGAIDREHLLISDNPDEIADLINDIFQNRNKYNYLKLNAKRLIEEHYTWENYELKLLQTLK